MSTLRSQSQSYASPPRPSRQCSKPGSTRLIGGRCRLMVGEADQQARRTPGSPGHYQDTPIPTPNLLYPSRQTAVGRTNDAEDYHRPAVDCPSHRTRVSHIGPQPYPRIPLAHRPYDELTAPDLVLLLIPVQLPVGMAATRTPPSCAEPSHSTTTYGCYASCLPSESPRYAAAREHSGYRIHDVSPSGELATGCPVRAASTCTLRLVALRQPQAAALGALVTAQCEAVATRFVVIQQPNELWRADPALRLSAGVPGCRIRRARHRLRGFGVRTIEYTTYRRPADRPRSTPVDAHATDPCRCTTPPCTAGPRRACRADRRIHDISSSRGEPLSAGSFRTLFALERTARDVPRALGTLIDEDTTYRVPASDVVGVRESPSAGYSEDRTDRVPASSASGCRLITRQTAPTTDSMEAADRRGR
ncbi:uncharacterized protein B0H18DRAFT_1132102 [Fomitopsis serialis]|uniref:uncharacterized protein n=1 Tax=Fomitopsis serialis TaxID=139415 RepID=UPI0020085D79|nr:uncharacterized protein B0H18DRAFT_1132102 [Neoantrodia serialis]KAH9905545.1 hypothetical protein B0H18DRAFT_1132102 [Neoantrodia serialis]